MSQSIADRACAKAARMISAAQDRPLTLTERVALRLHVAICDGCANYEKQVQFLRRAMGRWANYTGDDSGKP
jgi:Putative zinc-finger